MIRIGLMGCGLVADYGHLPAIVATPGLKLTALFDPNPERLAIARKKFGNPQCFDDAEAFASSGLDAVAITSPAPTHHENVLLAALHGLHVLCEKPLAMNDAECESMINAMEAADRKLYVGFTYRFSPAAMEIRKLVSEGAIGDVRSLRLVYIWDCHGKYATRKPGETALNVHRVGRMLEGGPIVDCGVHQIDLARWWTGSEVVRYQGFGAWVDDEGYAAPDHMWVHMDHASGAHSMIESSYSYGHTADRQVPHYVFELIGSKGVLRYCRDDATFEMRSAAGTKRFDWHEEKNFPGMYRQFARALETGDQGALVDAREAMLITQIAERATKQAMTNRHVPEPAELKATS